MVQLVAFPFAILYGKLSAKYGVRNMILFGIATYMVVCLVALALEPLRRMGEIPLLIGFVLLAFLVGTAQGGIQALSRSFYGKLVPESSANEFFGFFDIFGKFSAVLGPFLFSLVWDSTQQVYLGIIPVLLMFVAGLLLFLKVPSSMKMCIRDRRWPAPMPMTTKTCWWLAKPPENAPRRPTGSSSTRAATAWWSMERSPLPWSWR